MLKAKSKPKPKPKARPKARPKVGVVGLGNMGGGIARNLARAGLPLAVWDTAPRAMKPFAGHSNVTALHPGEMAGCCAAIIFVVPASPEIDAHLKGKSGVLANADARPANSARLALYDFTTSDPAYTKRLARRAAKKGVDYLDAGMSGGAAGAAAGTLTLMMGGDKAALSRTRRYLKPFTNKIFHLGPSGSGHTLKLIHNMVCHSCFMATVEGGRMAERAGLDLAQMIEVFNVANARSYASEVRFPKHILNKKWDAKSRVYNLHKDLGMAVALGKSLGTEVSHGEATLGFLKKAIAMGMSEKDYALLYRDFEKIRKARKKK
ncbi:MAG: NAD(P)-dependent oxidoreductase [Nitrospinota bacterium]|jgi:3-hydroxyisobutyrate dehydrogenase|nr:NAD(P)-dependent oxidoreductase [Nitrospinota bacterium]